MQRLSQLSQSQSSANWLNPIRRAHVDALTRWLDFRGGRVLLDEDQLREAARELDLTTHQWWTAAHDGHTTRRLTVRYAGKLVAVELRAPETLPFGNNGHGRGGWRS